MILLTMIYRIVFNQKLQITQISIVNYLMSSAVFQPAYYHYEMKKKSKQQI